MEWIHRGSKWDSLQFRNGIHGPFPTLWASSKTLQRDKCEEQATIPLRRHPVTDGAWLCFSCSHSSWSCKNHKPLFKRSGYCFPPEDVNWSLEFGQIPGQVRGRECHFCNSSDLPGGAELQRVKHEGGTRWCTRQTGKVKVKFQFKIYPALPCGNTNMKYHSSLLWAA